MKPSTRLADVQTRVESVGHDRITTMWGVLVARYGDRFFVGETLHYEQLWDSPLTANEAVERVIELA